MISRNIVVIFLDYIFLRLIDVILKSMFQAIRMKLLIEKKDIEKMLRTIYF